MITQQIIQHTHHNSQKPIPSLVAKSASGVQQKEHHDDKKCQGVDIWRYAKCGTVEKAKYAECPDNTKHCCQLHDVLFRKVVARVQFKDENMVDSRRSPSINVDAHQEEKQNEKQRTTVETHHNAPIIPVRMEYSCKRETINYLNGTV